METSVATTCLPLGAILSACETPELLHGLTKNVTRVCIHKVVIIKWAKYTFLVKNPIPDFSCRVC